MKKKYRWILQGVIIGLYLIGLGGVALGGNWRALIPFLLLLIPLGVYLRILTREARVCTHQASEGFKTLLSYGKGIVQNISSQLEHLPNTDSQQTRLQALYQRIVKEEELRDAGSHISLEKMVSLVNDFNQELEAVIRELVTQTKYLEVRVQKDSSLEQELQSLCSIHLPLEVTDKWKNIASERWDAVSNDTLDSLSQIKEMEDSNVRFVQEVITQFQRQQNSYEIYTESYQESLKQYFSKVEGIRAAYERDLDTSTQEVQNAFAQFQQINDIVGRIKLISLNMSIEASKVKGSGAFGLLARELRRLAEFTEETLKRISQRIQTTLEEVERNKEKQIQEFSTIIGIVDHFKEISSQYDKTTIELTEYIHRAIHQIELNQKKERDMLMKFFQNLQNIAIYKEELTHVIHYQKNFLERVDRIVQQIVREHKICRGEACPDRREALELLASLVTTDEERRFINALYKEYLGIDREETHGRLSESQEGVVLF
ncbi:MAG: hypothetical protein N2442_03975 [Spirochaetes bacterium]|nr:hypothetical protein [Spirochaetota bacterium]